MSLTIAMAGFRHPHAMSILNNIIKDDRCELIACCEADPEVAQSLEKYPNAWVDYENYDKMLDTVECDVVAIGDVYREHGPMAIRALQAGKHVICDKPLCLEIKEQEQIEKISSEQNLCVSCTLDLRSFSPIICLKDVVVSGMIGELLSITIFGQHPLSLDTRPSWYFKDDCHGGTLIDIGIHAIDLATWLGDCDEFKFIAAEEWNLKAKKYPHFKDAAQFMIRNANGVGILGDMSYHLPEKLGFIFPKTWNVECYGTKGYAQTACIQEDVRVILDGDKAERRIVPDKNDKCVWFDDFINEIQGRTDNDSLNTCKILKVSRNTIEMKMANADK